MVNYLLWDRWEPPSPPPIPPGTPKPEESGNSSSGSSTVSEDLWLLAPLSAAGKSTVKLANKNVWNRWLSAGEDMPGEINISARTTRKKGSCEEGKKKKKKRRNGESCSANSTPRFRDFQARNRSCTDSQGAKLFLCSIERRDPASDQAGGSTSQKNMSFCQRIHSPHVLKWFNSLCSTAVFPPPPPSRWKPGNTSLHFTWCSAVKFNFGEI